MRDIVNLKMRRVSSMSQPSVVAIRKPKRYTEFNSRLDSLVNKVDRLALGPERQTGSDEEQPSDRCDSQDQVPPILDENVKYKKVKLDGSLGVTPYKSLSSFFPPDFGKMLENKRSFAPGVVFEDARSEPEDEEVTVDQSALNIDIYRILLSGHIVEGSLPKIIVNLNYSSPDVLENLAPDFKQHVKDGNIDIFVTGKFFTENILEESAGAPVRLRVGANNIPVDDSCEIHEKRFSDVFDVGPIDIWIEGEFVKNPDTLKYVPTFSLQILKKDVFDERCNAIDVEPTTVLYSKDYDVMTPFDVNDDAVKNQLSNENRSLKKGKRVHYADHNEGTHEEFELKAKSIFEMIKKSKMYKKITLQKEESSDDTSKSGSNHRLVRKTSSRMRRESLVKRKLKLRGREKQTKHNKARQELGINHQEVKIYHASGKSKSPFQEKCGDQQLNEKKRRKKKKGNIVNNPILAQMQEFFIT